MDVGYDAPNAVARPFRQRFGQSPSSFRKSPDWGPWLAAFEPLDNARSNFMSKTFTNGNVTIREVPPTPVAIIEHRGDPATLGTAIQRFITWRRAAGLHPRTNPTFTVWRSERRPGQPADYCLDLCVGTDRRPIDAMGEQIKAGRNSRWTLRRAAGRRQHPQSGARSAPPLSRLASRQRRGNARFPDLLPAPDPLPGNLGAGVGRRSFPATLKDHSPRLCDP